MIDEYGGDIQKIFTDIDLDNDDFVSKKELMKHFVLINNEKNQPLDSTEIHLLWSAIDANADGNMDFKEFQRAFHHDSPGDRIKNSSRFSHMNNRQLANLLLKLVDSDLDDAIGFDEFVKVFDLINLWVSSQNDPAMLAYMHIRTIKAEIDITESEYNDMGFYSTWEGLSDPSLNRWTKGLVDDRDGHPGTAVAKKCRLLQLNGALESKHKELIQLVESAECTFWGPFGVNFREKQLNHLMAAFCLIHTSVLSLYNSPYINEAYLDWAHGLCTLMHVADVCQRAWQCGGFGLYLHIRLPTNLNAIRYYRRTLPNRQFSRRSEFSFVVLASVGLLAFSTASFWEYFMGTQFPLIDENNPRTPGKRVMRMLMSLSILRLVMLVENSSTLLYALYQGLKPFRIYFGIWFFLWYTFSAAATWCFGRPEDFGPHHKPFFDSFLDSFLTLFQLTVGEGWHEVMYYAEEISGNFAIWFFITYTFVVSVLFVQMFIGFIIDVAAGQAEVDQISDADMSEHTDMSIIGIHARYAAIPGIQGMVKSVVDIDRWVNANDLVHFDLVHPEAKHEAALAVEKAFTTGRMRQLQVDQKTLFLHAFSLKKEISSGKMPIDDLTKDGPLSQALFLLGHSVTKEELNQALLLSGGTKHKLKDGQSNIEGEIVIHGPQDDEDTKKAVRLAERIQLINPALFVATGLKIDLIHYATWLRSARRALYNLKNIDPSKDAASAVRAHGDTTDIDAIACPTICIGEMFVGSLKEFEDWAERTYTLPIHHINEGQFLDVSRWVITKPNMTDLLQAFRVFDTNDDHQVDVAEMKKFIKDMVSLCEVREGQGLRDSRTIGKSVESNDDWHESISGTLWGEVYDVLVGDEDEEVDDEKETLTFNEFVCKFTN